MSVFDVLAVVFALIVGTSGLVMLVVAFVWVRESRVRAERERRHRRRMRAATFR